MYLVLYVLHCSELETIGWANIVSGVTGGYTGSLIFSQSIFARKRGVNSWCFGLTIVTIEICVFLSPVSVLAYLPKFTYGCMLLFICLDLMWQWLVRSYIV
jgi:SulP family sulfate permease